jgi:hypothetical protein
VRWLFGPPLRQGGIATIRGTSLGRWKAIRAQVFLLATDEVLGIADVLIKFQASHWKS